LKSAEPVGPGSRFAIVNGGATYDATITTYERPSRLVFDASRNPDLTVTYSFSPTDDGTELEGELDFHPRGVRRDPAEMPQWPLVTYVDDVARAMLLAKEAAGDKDVLVHGAGTAQLGPLRPGSSPLREPGHGADRAGANAHPRRRRRRHPRTYRVRR
jgi:hypothetical protein